MSTSTRIWLNALVILALLPLVPRAAESRPHVARSSAKPTDHDKEVELFAAMKAGDIEVQIIPKNAEEARVLVKNTTKVPLHIAMPAAFAAMPVLAQFGGGQNRTGGGGTGGGGGMNQGMGGGMGGGMMGGGMMGGGMGGGMGRGGGFFNVAPEKVGQIKVGLLCLEHGKKDPRAGIPYELKPIESLTSNPAIRGLLSQFANDKYHQRAAQAAAWHLNNNMSWQELAAKTIPHLNRPAERYFSATEIQLGMRIAEDAKVHALESAPPPPTSTERSEPTKK